MIRGRQHEDKSAFDKIAVERKVPQLALNSLQSFDNGENFVQQYSAGLYLFGVVDKETGFLKEVTVGKEFVLSKSKRQSEVDEILNTLSKNPKNSSVVTGNAEYSSLLFDNGKSLSLSIKAKDSVN